MTVNRAKILLIEGKRSEHPSLLVPLTKKGFLVESVPNGSAALARLGEIHPDLIIIDAASMRTSGKRICQSLRANAPRVPLVLILAEGSPKDESTDANVMLNLPFTPQKLRNRIKHLLPTAQKDVLQLGPLQLNIQQRWVKCGEKQSRLTPRLVVLLKMLMEHPGEMIPRETLFRQVWDTTYAGDMRTLDVHISWLRRAIEDDPSHPRYIKTLRGIGYRLDVE